MFLQLVLVLSVPTEPTWATLDNLGKILPDNSSVRAH